MGWKGNPSSAHTPGCVSLSLFFSPTRNTALACYLSRIHCCMKIWINSHCCNTCRNLKRDDLKTAFLLFIFKNQDLQKIMKRDQTLRTFQLWVKLSCETARIFATFWWLGDNCVAHSRCCFIFTRCLVPIPYSLWVAVVIEVNRSPIKLYCVRLAYTPTTNFARKFIK